MKTKILRLYNVSILKFLAILGFMSVNTGCAMYGVEKETFINGKVSSKKTLQPIEGIEVCARGCIQTDEAGMYEIWAGRHFNLSFYDPAGNYERFDTLIEVTERRNTVRKTIDIQLTPKTPQDEN